MSPCAIEAIMNSANSSTPKVWEIQTGQIRNTFAGHEQDIYSLDFASNGRHIASGSGDHTVRVWDIEQSREILNLQIEDGVTTVAISPGGHYVAAGSLDKSVRVWDISSGNIIARLDGLDGHKDSVYSVAFGPDGETLVSGSLDKTIKMWQLSPDTRGMLGGQLVRGGRLVRTFEGHKVSNISQLAPYEAGFNPSIGFCSQRRHDTGCGVGHERIKGSGSAVLEPTYWRYAVDASRS